MCSWRSYFVSWLTKRCRIIKLSFWRSKLFIFWSVEVHKEQHNSGCNSIRFLRLKAALCSFLSGMSCCHVLVAILHLLRYTWSAGQKVTLGGGFKSPDLSYCLTNELLLGALGLSGTRPTRRNAQLSARKHDTIPLIYHTSSLRKWADHFGSALFLISFFVLCEFGWFIFRKM